MTEFPIAPLDQSSPLHLLASLVAVVRPQWIPVSEKLPVDRQAVLFVVDGRYWQPHLTGRVLGGAYDAVSGNFSVPGLGLIASHWMPAPPAPHDPRFKELMQRLEEIEEWCMSQVSVLSGCSPKRQTIPDIPMES